MKPTVGFKPPCLYSLAKAGELGKTSERNSLMRKNLKNKGAGSGSRGNAAPEGVCLSQENCKICRKCQEKRIPGSLPVTVTR